MNYTNYSMKTALAVAVAASLFVGCASTPKKPLGSEQVRAKLTALQGDSRLANGAPVALKDAEAAVREAERTEKNIDLAAHRGHHDVAEMDAQHLIGGMIAVQLREQRAAQDEPIARIPERESVRGEIDSGFQPAQQVARMGRVAPQHNPAAVIGLPRLHFDDAAIPQLHVARRIFAAAHLCASIGDIGLRALRAVLGDLAAGDLHPDQVFIGQADQRFALRQRAGDVVEMLAAIGEAFLGIEEGDGDAQAVERRHQTRRQNRFALDRALRACRQNHHNPRLFVGASLAKRAC